MPLPSPEPSESENDFVSRCMANETIRKDFPDQEQRAGVCYSQWRKKHGGGQDSAELISSLVSAPDPIKAKLADIAEQEIALKNQRDALMSEIAGLSVSAPGDTGQTDPDAGPCFIDKGDCRVLNRPPVKHLYPDKRIEARRVNDEEGEIIIYSDIGEAGIFGDSVSAKDFSDMLMEVGPVRNLTVRLNSYGGDVYEGIAIYNRLRSFNASTTVYVDGVAASIASVIAMAADKVVMFDNSSMMIHLPWTFLQGNEYDLTQIVEQLRSAKETLVSAYAYKTGLESEKIVDMMRKETWMSGEESVRLGFADEIDYAERSSMAASANREWIENQPSPKYLQMVAFSQSLAQAKTKINQLYAHGCAV